MLIQHKKINNRGMFYVGEEDNIVAEMIYSDLAPGAIIIEHTEVDEDLRGKDIGYALVHHAVEYARMHNLKILPVCPFAKEVFDKKPDFQDVLG